MDIQEVRELSDALLLALRALTAELAPAASPLTRERLQEIVASPSCRLLIAAASPGAEIAGMLILASYPIASGRRCWIEDVVVAAAARGQGIGEALVRRAIELARAAGAASVDLTSRPSRESANRLYLRLGFERRETNVYRLTLGQ
ncbi:MAG TPA: GNAT family N-acetyltransferase [Longimicrobiales bacterium]